MKRHEIIFKLLFEDPDTEKLVNYILETGPRCSDKSPNPFGDDNLSEIFGRLAECKVFTEAAREKYAQMSEIVSHAVDIEVEMDYDAHQKVKTALKSIPS